MTMRPCDSESGLHRIGPGTYPRMNIEVVRYVSSICPPSSARAKGAAKAAADDAMELFGKKTFSTTQS